MNTSQELDHARTLLNQGRLPEAVRLCEALVTHQRRNADAHHLLGRAQAMSGRFKEAAGAFREALSNNPAHAAALSDLGFTLTQLGQHADALATLRQAAAIDPGPAAVHFALGCAALAAGDAATAATAYGAALQRDPSFLEAANGLGIAEMRLGRAAEAVRWFQRVAHNRPAAPEAHSALGAALLRSGQPGQAIASLEQSLALRPHDLATLQDLGTALGAVGRHQDAIDVLTRAAGIGPGDPDILNELGAALLLAGRADEAVVALERATALDPGFVEAIVNLAEALRKIDRHDESLAQFQRALSLAPSMPQALAGLGRVSLALGDSATARTHLQRAVELAPDMTDVTVQLAEALERDGDRDAALAALRRSVAANPEAADVLRALAKRLANTLDPATALPYYERLLALVPQDAASQLDHANLLESQGRVDQAVAAFRSVLVQRDDDVEALSGLLSCGMRLCDWSLVEPSLARLRALPGGIEAISPFALLAVSDEPQEHLRSSTACAAALAARIEVLPRPAPVARDRIRLAYVSPDFRDHPVANLVATLIERHDRNRFEVIGAALTPAEASPLGQRIRAAFDSVHDLHDLDDAAAARRLRDLDVDIAIDLAGFTKGHRSAILAARPARLQVNYLGFPGSMGAPYIDYIVADPALIPAEHAGNFSERVAWLPDTYQVNDRQIVADEVPDRAALSLPPDGFVFCCFNNSFKFTAPVFAAWMRILKNVPGSVLWLATDSSDVVANLRTQARRHDVHPDRLVFAPRVARREDHLARHRRADLFLDTMPFNAHATASDALWCGLPVLTCAGQTFAGRVAASLAGQSGLDALVCRDLTHYESVAVDLAHDPQRLSQLRQALNEKRETGPLFDADRFRRNLEAAYQGMWQRWCDGLAPESFRAV